MCAYVALSPSVFLSVYLSVCLSLSLSVFGGCFVFLRFGGSETLIKINIIGFSLRLTNGVFPGYSDFSDSSPGMFGLRPLLPVPPPRIRIAKLSSLSLSYCLSLSFSLSLCLCLSVCLSFSLPPPPSPPPLPSRFSITRLCHLSFTS